MAQKQAKKTIAHIIARLEAGERRIPVIGAQGSARALIVAQIWQALKQTMVVVAASPAAAREFRKDLSFFTQTPQEAFPYFPPYNILPFKHLAYHSETAAMRLRTLYELGASSAPALVVTSVEALMQFVIPRAALDDYTELAMVGEELERSRLLEKLTAGGYARTVIVEEPGDFAVRGGILDVFSPLYKNPLRIEFFGDEVDSLRFFSAVTQRTLKRVEEAIILPAKESILLPPGSFART